MSLNPSQIINNLKKSFNVYVETQLSGENINFDTDPYDTSGLETWYAVRYTGIKTENVGIGDLIDDATDSQGRIHVLKAELSAWSRDDSQRAVLGPMIDKIIKISETVSIALYDFDEPENPVEFGKIKIKPGDGVFSPVWGGSSGGVLKSSGDLHAGNRIQGFVQAVELETIAEV